MDAVVSSSFMMDRLAIFFCIFGVFYFTNLAFSRVLNYSEERKDLCKIAGIQGRECTPEEKALVQAGYEARQRAENERERAENERERAENERERADAELKRAVSAEKDKKQSDRVVGAVAGRGVVEALYMKYVKKYLPTKQPGVKYTKLEMDQAYVDFLNDVNNDLAKALMTELKQNVTSPNDLAIKLRKIYGKLSFINHSLFDTLIKMQCLEHVIDYIRAIPAALTDLEIFIIERIATVLVDHEESYTLPEISDTSPQPPALSSTS